MAKIVSAMVMILFCGGLAIADDRVFNIEGNAIAVGSRMLFIVINDIAFVDILIKSPANETVWITGSVRKRDLGTWRNSLKSIGRFRVRPSEGVAEILVPEYIRNSDGQTARHPAPFWEILPGGKNTNIPFGKKVPFYESIDWPLLPVI